MSSLGAQVITVLVMSAETGKVWSSAFRTATPMATSRSEITPSTVFPSPLTIAAPMRLSLRSWDSVPMVSDGLIVKTTEPFNAECPLPSRYYSLHD